MRDKKYIFDGKATIEADHINGYLFDGPTIHVRRRAEPLCAIPPMNKGSQPTDGGNLIIEADAIDDFIRREPRAEKFIHQYVGADEFINGKARYCLWLVDATEDDLRLPLIADRIERCRCFRLSSKKAATRKAAATPSLFTEIRQPSTEYIIVPLVSGDRRRYVPMGFMTPDVIVSNLISVIPDAQLFHFSILESLVHMAWMRIVAGRLGMSYRYSGTLVYNNFPWVKPTLQEEFRLATQAQLILDIRDDYADEMTLAEMYNPESMPEELRAAHAENDRLVMALYGFDRSMTETEVVTQLLFMYEELSNAR